MLLAGIWGFVLSSGFFWPFMPFAILMTGYLSISYFIIIMSRGFELELTVPTQAYPRIDVYLPCCGEPLEILENTYRSVRRLDWPEGKLHVYILDDSRSAAVAYLAEKYEFNYIARQNQGELKKAGNLRHAFAKTEGEFFVVFDADFCPRPDFIKTLMPYFDGNTAIVQSPQFFTIDRRQTWVEKGAAYVQELFYRLVQVSRDYHSGPICVGSNAIYRRNALKPFGGTAPIAYSEDVHTGFLVTNNFWRVRYVPLNLAKGVCPYDTESYFLQQYRWATGSLTLFFNSEFWKSRLNFMQKVCYLSGMLYYLATGLSVVLMPLPSLILIWFFPEYVHLYNIAFVLPSFLFGSVVVPMWTTAPFGPYVWMARTVSQYAHLFALIDKFKGSLIPWRATGANGKSKRYMDMRRFMIIWTLVTVVLTWAGVYLYGHRLHDFLSSLFFLTFSAIVNLAVILRSK